MSGRVIRPRADDPIRTREQNEEVLFVDAALAAVRAADVERLKERAAQNARRRIRLCTHRDVNDPVHEMLIVHRRETYVRPHKHVSKTESFHVIEGTGRVVIFDDAGSMTHVIPLGDHRSGLPFYYRLGEPLFHTLLIDSEVIVFHETARGPFDPNDTVFPPWAPDEGDDDGIRAFTERLRRGGEGD